MGYGCWCYGFMRLTWAINNLFVSQGLSGEIKVLQCLKFYWAFNCEERRNTLIGFPCLHCFVNADGRKTTPSGLNLWWYNCSNSRSANVRSIISLRVSDRVVEGSTFPRFLSTGEQVAVQSISNCLWITFEQFTHMILLMWFIAHDHVIVYSQCSNVLSKVS